MVESSWGDSGYERFTLVWKTNCIRQPDRQLILQPQHTDIPRTSVRESSACFNPLCTEFHFQRSTKAKDSSFGVDDLSHTHSLAIFYDVRALRPVNASPD